MAFKFFCPECLEERSFEEYNVDENFYVKDEVIPIEAFYYKCSECGELILDPENEDLNYLKAYHLYKQKKNLLTGDEIKAIRDYYNLSQRQLAKILGWSHATLSKYESGAIQSVSHNNELILIKEPENMLRVVEQNKDGFSEKFYLKTKEKIEAIINKNKKANLYYMIEQMFDVEPNEFTGFKHFNLDKVINVVKYFTYRDPSVYKVKLMKYLFFTDFLNFKNINLSVTGLQYCRLKMGPVPHDYDMLLNLILNEDSSITRDYIDFGNGQGELFSSSTDFDSSLFERVEIETIERVLDIIYPHNSKSVSELSHEESAWIETDDGKKISYKHASELKIV